MPKRFAQWLIILCILAAALLRFPLLESVPPGLHYDEAANLLLSGDIGLRGERPIFISSYTGKEVLFFYAAGGLMALLGESIFTLRLTAAFMGLLTVAAVYRLGVLLLRRRDVALVAAVLLAMSFWHLLFSRLGFRAIAQPLLQSLTLIGLFNLLWRNAKPFSWRDPNLWLTGLFLGGTAYTYLAARLFPIALALGLIPLLFKVDLVRQAWAKLAAVGGLALLVVSPLLTYFYRFPEAFWVRIQQVGQASGSDISIWQGIWRSLLMIGWAGDPYWRFNLPEQPLFNPLWTVFLLVGLASLLLQLFRQRGVAQSALWLIVIGPLVMILPTALATNEILPSNLRAIGMIPFIFFWSALGAVEALALSYQILRLGGDRSLRWQWLVTGIVVSILLFEGVNVGQTYFVEWGEQAAVFYENDGDLSALATYLNEQELVQPIFVAAEYDQHPTVAALADNYDSIGWLPGGEAIVWPASEEGLIFYTHNQPPAAWAIDLLDDPFVVGEAGPDGEPTFQGFRLSRTPSAPPLDTTVNANFGYAVRLLGYQDGSGTAGQTLPLTLWWQVEGLPQSGLRLFAHVEDRWGHRWSQMETDSYPLRHWEVGQRFVTHFDLDLPEGIPPGFYRLKVGWFDPATGQQVARFDLDGRYAGPAFVIEEIPVLAAAEIGGELEPSIRLDGQFWPEFSLLGADPTPETVDAGGFFSTALFWRSEAAELPEFSIRYELLRPNRTGIILSEGQPVHGSYPFRSWVGPQQVIDRQTHQLPTTVAAGEYLLHLRVIGNDDATLYEADLGRIEVTASERIFTPPSISEAVGARFGGEIDLLGVNRRLEEDQFIFELIWQAVEQPAADYTVFFHVLNTDGSCCVWQADRPPPVATGRWLAGQVVVDQYAVPLAELPAGEYMLEVGLFLAESGIRLEVVQGELSGQDFVLLDELLLEDEE
ncbi:MAG: hypothetical protein QNJ45_13695 [Ardenticatenaceae bacterium]|nr:hypothetical protein [Ardenticatenaceae bacterium]